MLFKLTKLYEKMWGRTRRLMKISDAEGKITMSEIAVAGSISRTMVKTEDAFILDDGATIFVWIGQSPFRPFLPFFDVQSTRLAPILCLWYQTMG